MAFNDYIQRDKIGNIYMALSNLPSNAFVDATKVRTVATIRILDRKKNGIQSGGNDVKVTNASGEVNMISRKELINSYRTPQNKKINLAFLKHDKDYAVVNFCQENYKVIKIPDNCNGVLNGRKIQPGSYAICKADENGNPIMSTISVVSPKMFRKMFTMPMQPIIQRHLGKNGGAKLSLFDKPRIKTVQKSNMAMANRMNTMPNKNKTVINHSPITGIPHTQIKQQPNNMQQTQQRLQRMQRPINQAAVMQSQIKNNQTTASHYKVRVINKVMNKYNTTQQVGFTVQNIKTGEQKQISMMELAQLCEQKIVENVKLVTKDGNRFLQGNNNTALKDLPEVLSN